MLVIEFVFALAISILCAAILLPVAAQAGWWARRPKPEPLSLFLLLLILFLATWAGGIWLVPIGPKLWGVAWAGFVAVGFLVALLIGALIGPRDVSTGAEFSRVRPRVINLLSLLVLILLVLAIVAGYASLHHPVLQAHVATRAGGLP